MNSYECGGQIDNSSTNHNNQPGHRLGPSISHSLQKHSLDRMEFQATIGASNKGILFATLLGGERERGDREREEMIKQSQ